MHKIVLTYPRRLLLRWKSGVLVGEWFSKHKGLFDADDFRLACNQHAKGYHFGEWFTALYYRQKGYHVLQSKYANPKHKRKHLIALRLLGPRNLQWLWRPGRPDLLVFRRKQFFFVEVKRDRDRLSSVQIRFFKSVEERFQAPVWVVRLKAAGK